MELQRYECVEERSYLSGESYATMVEKVGGPYLLYADVEKAVKENLMVIFEKNQIILEREKMLEEKEREWVGITTEEMNKNERLREQIATLSIERSEWIDRAMEFSRKNCELQKIINRQAEEIKRLVTALEDIVKQSGYYENYETAVTIAQDALKQEEVKR